MSCIMRLSVCFGECRQANDKALQTFVVAAGLFGRQVLIYPPLKLGTHTRVHTHTHSLSFSFSVSLS